MKYGFLFLIFVTNAFSSPLAIYGKDDRKDIYESSNSLLKKIARSTVAMIPNHNIAKSGEGFVISGKLLKDVYNLCPGEKFKEQLTAANCSGTLIDKDIILTAGHCVGDGNLECNNNKWVFDYKADSAIQRKVTLNSSSVYECKEIIHRTQNYSANIDFALIRLDRAVLDRDPINMSVEENIQEGTPLALIGHPRGLPTKIAEGGYAVKVNKDFIKTNLDAFSINSGSGVFNQETGELEGILVSGQLDFKEKKKRKSTCTQSVIYSDSDAGEVVTKIKFVWEQIGKF